MVCDGYAYKSVGAEAAGDANIYVNTRMMYWSTRSMMYEVLLCMVSTWYSISEIRSVRPGARPGPCLASIIGHRSPDE